jgi:hypothetical protein
MTLNVLFSGLGAFVNSGVALTDPAVSGLGGAHVSFGLQSASLASLSIVLAAYTARRAVDRRTRVGTR